MVTSQNVSSDAQDKNVFICRKGIFHSQDIQVFNHPMIYQISDVMMNIST